jgi:proteasome accessory factor B
VPKETYLPRLSLIIKRLQKSPATYEQINDYLKRESEIHGYDYTISIRTFQRDIKDIYTNYEIEIANEKKDEKKYFIKNKPDDEEHNRRLLDAYQMKNIIEAAQDYKKYVFLETRRANGSEHFQELLYAVKNKKAITFNHFKYWEDIIRERTVHGLALKEAKGRWYLIAIDTKGNKLKTFGLDRMSDLEISKTSFRNKYDFNIKEMFLHSFGIINLENEKPQKIRLSFTWEQGQYVKNFSLHHSQKVIEEKGDEVIIELYLSITDDFIMELLSFDEEVTVLSPKSLINQLKKIYTNALKKYSC